MAKNDEREKVGVTDRKSGKVGKSEQEKIEQSVGGKGWKLGKGRTSLFLLIISMGLF